MAYNSCSLTLLTVYQTISNVMVSIINELLSDLSPNDFVMVISYFTNSKQHVPESTNRAGETHRHHYGVIHADLIFVFMELLSLVFINVSYLGSDYELA